MNSQPNSVLIVDDNEDIRTLLARYIKRQGHTVTSAENDCQALEMVRAQPFDLILLDIMRLIFPKPGWSCGVKAWKWRSRPSSRCPYTSFRTARLFRCLSRGNLALSKMGCGTETNR